MSYSLAVQSGDLVLQGTELAIVYGISKLKQDLMLWTQEGYGVDRFHPDMGSALQDAIGSVISPHTHAQIQSEMARILDNYARVQLQGFKANPRVYSLTELLASVDDINVGISYDTVRVGASVRTAASATTNVTFSSALGA